MKTRARFLLPILAALAIAVSAQQADPKPSPAPAPAPAPKKAPAKKQAPARPPTIVIKTATTDGVVIGHTSDPNHKVSLTVSDSKTEARLTTSPDWPDTEGNFSILVPSLRVGWIVQAWLMDGDTRLAGSNPKPVLPAPKNDNPAAAGSVQSSASAAIVARTPEPSPAPVAAPVERQPQPVATCDDGNADSEAMLLLSDGDSEIRGHTSKFPSGSVFVCVNGVEKQIRDTSEANSLGGTLNKSKFDVTLSNGFKLNEGNFVLVAVLTDKGERTTIQATVGPPKVITAQACDSLTRGDQKIEVETGVIDAGISEIKGTVPDPPGNLSVCVNDSQVDIAAGPGPATDKTKYSGTLKTDGNQFDLLLKSALQENQTVRIAWLKDSVRSIKDLQVKPAAFSRVIVPSVPKEGETLIKVDTAKPPDGNDKSKSPLSLAVFVNQDRVTLLDTKGGDAGAIPVDASGETGLTLKNPVDGGDCVVVLEFSGPSLPAQLDFNKLACDAKTKVPKTQESSLGYAQSYPLLANSLFNWGRVRGYMTAGGLFSFDNGNFSQQSVFLAFNMTKNWIWGGPFVYYDQDKQLVNGYKRVMFETFFDARLTSLPVAACTSSSSTPTTTAGSTPTPSPQSGSTTSTQGSSTPAAACPNTLDTFLSTRKSAVLNGGVSIPFIVSTWRYGHRPYAISFGPLAKIGFDTPVSDPQSGTTLASQQQFYTNFGFGTRLGLYRMSYSPNVAPELESYVDIVTGRYSNFDISPTDGSRYARPWRIGIEGVLKVPTTPFILGFGANVHQNFGLFGSKTVDHAKDSLQFLFGAKFDAGKLFNKIGSIK